MGKTAQRSAPRVSSDGRLSEMELRELRQVEARIRAGTEKGIDGQIVMLETMRDLAKIAKRRRA